MSLAGTWIDGEPASNALLADRALHYGDGLFETIGVRAGRARFLELHARRLANGCRRLGIACDARTALHGAVEAIGPAAGHGTLKVIVSRGDAIARGYAPNGAERARVIACWYPGALPVAPTSLDAIVLAQRWGENPALAGLKHLNRLEQVLARRELAERGGDEAIVLSSSGLVCSGTQSNVFVAFERALVTPRVDRAGIAGIMRAVVLREAERLGIAMQVADLPLPALRQARSVFFTNARIGVQFVTRLEARALAQPVELTRLAAVVDSLDE